MTASRLCYVVIRLVIAGWLLGWYIKLEFYWPYLTRENFLYPLHHPLFPSFCQSPAVALGAYLLPLYAGVGLWTRQKEILLAVSIVMTLSATVLNLHVTTHNDATFVTSFWTGLWLMWFSGKMMKGEAVNGAHAQALIQAVVGLIFLGGVVGKLTPEFFNGDVLMNIFISPGNTSPLNKMVAALPDESRRWLMTGTAFVIVVMEGLLALAPLWRYRTFVYFATANLLLIPFFSTWRILSVVSCLIGLLWAGLRLEKSRQPLVPRA